MNVQEILLAQSVQLGKVHAPGYLPDMIGALKDRYGFVNVPTSAVEILPPKAGTPLVFSHGKFVDAGHTIVIRFVRIYPDGFIVETATSTDDSDRVSDDLIALASAAPGSAIFSPTRAYASQLVVKFGAPAPLERFLSITAPVGKMIEGLYSRYGQDMPAFQPHSFGMGADPTVASLTCDFRIERRAKIAFDQELYFSQAPLKTADHIAVLEEFERVTQAASG